MSIAVVLFVIAAIFVIRAVKVVPQQNAWVVERLGKYHAALTPGLNFLIPFVDKVAYKHSLKEIPLDVPPQVCITRDNTQLQVDGILYFQVTDPMRASYGSSNYIVAITQLAQTTLRSVIGRMELDRTFEERDQINIATGEREASIARSEGEKQAEINKALGEAAAITAVADATADAIRKIAAAIQQPGGEQAVQLKVAEKAVEAFAQLAQKNNTMIVPGNMTEVAALIGSAMTLIKPRVS